MLSQAAPAVVEIGVPEPNTLASEAQAVLRAAYARLGLEFRPRVLPLRRALLMAENGELDGDLMRASAVLKDNPNLLQVRVPVARAVYSAYKRGSDCPTRIAVEELAQHRVAYFRGIRVIEMLLPAQSLVGANNSWDALRLLQHGITDYVLGMQPESDALLLANGVQSICRIAEPVVTQALYHALHKRHAELLPRLEAVLAEMESRGEIARLWAAEERRALLEAARTRPNPPP